MKKAHMTGKKDHDIRQDFKKRQTRQILGVAAALFLVLLVAVIYKKPDIFGEFSRVELFAAQALVISAFVGFTAVNWKCPACRKHLGGDISRNKCRKCGTRLQ